jgi:tricorn protease
MVAELSVGHAYIQGGDFEIPDRPKVGLPGARFSLDASVGRYKIGKIMKGQNEEPKYRAPLTEVGVNISEGDYILAIDGEELKGEDNPYRLLQHKTDPVVLTVNATPSLEGSRKVTYEPITSESSLLYLEWVEGNRKKVLEATDGKVGYIHIPDMGANGIYEFIKWYYPQIRKEGLVVDVRSNGGGNVSQWIIERLDTRLLGTRFGQSSDKAQTYPYSVFHGHMACLLNETSASDGDIFPHRFREAGLGPLIGKRSWGGVVGISGRGPLLDGGTVFVPLQGTNDTEGNWIIEGEGVTPDIEVENDPKSILAGRDPQLERGILEVVTAMKTNPMKLPERPPDPIKTKKVIKP